MDDSQGFTNLNLNKSIHIEDPLAHYTMKKPVFSASSTIGGLLPKKRA